MATKSRGDKSELYSEIKERSYLRRLRTAACGSLQSVAKQTMRVLFFKSSRRERARARAEEARRILSELCERRDQKLLWTGLMKPFSAKCLQG